MSVTLPTAATALTNTDANQAAAIAAAQTAFIANVTVLINNAIANGFIFVEPYADPLIDPTFVVNYFTPLGYVVVFPVVPNYPYNPAFVPNFPEVLPSDIIGSGGSFSFPYGPPRYRISWGPIPVSGYPFPPLAPAVD